MNDGLNQGECQLQVLVVEDSLPFAKWIIARLKTGLTMPHQVHHADTVQSGVELLRRKAIDLVILDMHLPDGSGLDVFQAIQRAAPEVPIVILSGDDTEAIAMEAVRCGAQDYIIKGSDNSHQLMWSIRFAIERKKRLHAEAELQAGRIIQQSFLPNKSPSIDGYEITGAMYPAIETAGDYYDFLATLKVDGSPACGIAVGDVAGHGLGPAMTMSETRACLHSFALLESDIARLLELTNNVLCGDRSNRFVTLMLGYLDQQTNQFCYASAGHQGWHLSVDGTATELPATGMVLGVLPNETWEVAKSPPLANGDLLVLMTDGIAEAAAPSGGDYGNERALDLLQKHRDRDVGEMVQALRDDLTNFVGSHPQLDDMTIVLVKRVEE
ncbi:SpoIIE family protein phosphatase [Rubripirellula sp.]|nr:SpoIIE family protein phosphatase [Rubripirellula sp.]MDF1844786.1 SpoIIE family protein phosphatase [Rubripirellula sp.]